MQTTTQENLNPQGVCEECLQQTRINYKYDGSFFGPLMRSINHLEVGYSNIISNPITILLEYLYVVYKWFRDAYARLNQWLFPRRDKIFRGHIDSHIVGQLVYKQRQHIKTPIHHLKVSFWGRTRWLQWRKLSEGYSDFDGYFSLPFTLRCARNSCIGSLRVEVYEISHFVYKRGQPIRQFRCIKSIQIKPSDLIGMTYNLRQVDLEFWQYREDSFTPRAVVDLDANVPQCYAQGRIDALIQQVLPFELTKLKHLEQINEAPDTISIASIQADYPENLTVCIEKKLPGYTRSDDFFGTRMMNGMNRGCFLPDKTDANTYWVKYFGICNYDHNHDYALPTAEIRFRLHHNGLPVPDQIKLTGPINAYNRDPWQTHVFTPEIGDEWLSAKRQARVNGAVSTEVDEHFTGTHLNTEQYAIAAYRNFRHNPVAALLLPYLKEVAMINNSADRTIIHGYLPRATALTEKGLLHRTRDLLGVQDWKGWKPMSILSDAHVYARGETLFWDVVGKYVDVFFDEYSADIKQHWFEVYQFSHDLVEHAVPVFLSDIDLATLSPQERKLATDRLEYYCHQYAFDPALPRETVNQELKTVSPITKNQVFQDDQAEELQNLKDACRYAIMMATYMHTWINEHQYADIGEILYSGGGLRFGKSPCGILVPETDLTIAPDLTISTQMLWFTNFLSRTEYGFITRNEEGDVSPIFRALLEDQRDNFTKLGIDIDAIESRTNI